MALRLQCILVFVYCACCLFVRLLSGVSVGRRERGRRAGLLSEVAPRRGNVLLGTVHILQCAQPGGVGHIRLSVRLRVSVQRDLSVDMQHARV